MVIAYLEGPSTSIASSRPAKATQVNYLRVKQKQQNKTPSTKPWQNIRCKRITLKCNVEEKNRSPKDSSATGN